MKCKMHQMYSVWFSSSYWQIFCLLLKFCNCTRIIFNIWWHVNAEFKIVTVSSDVRIFEISNRIEYLLQYSIRNEHNYSKFSNAYRHQFITYLTEWCRFFTLATKPSNQQNQQTWSRQCRLKTKRSLIWSHFSQIGSDNANMFFFVVP